MRSRGALRNFGALRGSGGSRWTPAALGSSLKLWLRADLGVTNDGSGYCSAWADQSGNGYSFTQVTPASRPAIGTSINGKATLTFDGTDDSLGSADAASVYKFLSDGSQSHTFIIAAQTGSASRTSPWIANYDLGAAATNIGQVFATLADPLQRVAIYMANNTATLPINTSGGTCTDDVAHCLEYKIDGSAATKYLVAVDGATQYSSTAFSSAPSSSDPTAALRIGRDRGAAAYKALGPLAEIVVSTVTLTASQQALLETYFATRYAITFS